LDVTPTTTIHQTPERIITMKNNEEREAREEMEIISACEDLDKELALEEKRQSWDMHKPCKWNIPDEDEDE